MERVNVDHLTCVSDVVRAESGQIPTKHIGRQRLQQLLNARFGHVPVWNPEIASFISNRNEVEMHRLRDTSDGDPDVGRPGVDSHGYFEMTTDRPFILRYLLRSDTRPAQLVVEQRARSGTNRTIDNPQLAALQMRRVPKPERIAAPNNPPQLPSREVNFGARRQEFGRHRNMLAPFAWSMQRGDMCRATLQHSLRRAIVGIAPKHLTFAPG